MRILFVSNNYTPYSGGVVSAINAMVHELHAQGHEVQLITLNFLGRAHDDPSWVRRIPSVIRFRFKQNHMAIPWRPHFYMQQWMKAFNPDVVHVHHPFLLGSHAVRSARRLGIKTVFTYHTLYEAYAYYVPLPFWIVRPIIRYLVRSFCQQVDHIIAPSTGIKEYIRNHSLAQITVVPSGVQPLFLHQPFHQKQLTKPYELLYVGRLVREKNITALLDVAAQLSDDYCVTLVGYGEYTGYLQEYAYDFHRIPQGRVHFIIKPSKQTLLEAYQKAHLFLFTSQTDTQGLVLAEAMAYSLPVVALDGYGQRDIIWQAKNGFIVANGAQMKSTIEAVFRNPSLYASLQREAYATAQLYSPDRMLKSTLRIYGQI